MANYRVLVDAAMGPDGYVVHRGEVYEITDDRHAARLLHHGSIEQTDDSVTTITLPDFPKATKEGSQGAADGSDGGSGDPDTDPGAKGGQKGSGGK